MLCARCYKKIPKGEEVQKASNFAWRSSWGQGGYGSEIVCKNCGIKTDKWNRRFFLIFMTLFLVLFITILVVAMWSILIKDN